MANKKGSAVQKGHNNPPLSPETYLEYRRRCGITLTALQEAQSAHQAEMKRAKAAGIDTKAMAAVMKLRKRDPDEVALEERNKARYAAWENVPFGTQGALFDATDDQHPTEKAQEEFSLHRAEDDGRFCGRDGKAREDNPHTVGSERFVRWDTGWLAGQALIAAEMAEGTTKARSTRKRRDPPEADA